MALQIVQPAILSVDLPGDGLIAGDVGTVVDQHVAPGVDEVGYSVEFFDMTCKTVAVVTIPESCLRAPTPADRSSTFAIAVARGPQPEPS
jgi:hypothetical protein